MVVTEAPRPFKTKQVFGPPAATAVDGADAAGPDSAAQAELILSALEAGEHARAHEDRREHPRTPYRVEAHLQLFSDVALGLTPRLVYTRDVHPRGLGFITAHRLPLGHGGVIELPTGDGGTATVHCTLLRCREAAPGWYEGSVHFSREQPQLVPQD